MGLHLILALVSSILTKLFTIAASNFNFGVNLPVDLVLSKVSERVGMCFACLFNCLCAAAALQAFYGTLKDPSGNLANWVGNNPCENAWRGVVCDVPNSSNITFVTELWVS